MKKLIVTAAVLGAVSVPGIVMAHNGADDTATTVSHRVHQEGHAATNNVSENTTMHRNDDSQQSTVQTPTGSAKLETATRAPAGSIQPFEAATTAQAVFPGKTIVKVELEQEEGVAVYSVRFADNSRVDVNAVSGKVVRQQDGSATTTTTSGRHGADDAADDRGRDN